jgi:hypothetical protein
MTQPKQPSTRQGFIDVIQGQLSKKSYVHSWCVTVEVGKVIGDQKSNHTLYSCVLSKTTPVTHNSISMSQVDIR